MKLFFDCHCHIHLGPQGLDPLLQSIPSSINNNANNDADNNNEMQFNGAAIMSTHPRDYVKVDSVVSRLRDESYTAIPCYGVHPWFLHDVDNIYGEEEDWEWLVELRKHLIDNPEAIVGEIGLDGARWREVEEEDDGDNKRKDMDDVTIWNRKRILSCPMDIQQKAFEQQLYIASELERPVSIHVVKAWGELFDSFETVRDKMRQKYLAEEKEATSLQNFGIESKQSRKKKKKPKKLLLPPTIYFHAFSGKAGVINSLIAACEKGNVSRENVFFGFAPAIPNFYTAKTPSIMRQIGINQLVIETDLEDSTNVYTDLQRGVEGIASAVDVDANKVTDITYQNAKRLYFGRI